MSPPDSYYIELLTNIPIYVQLYLVPILYVAGNIGNLLTVGVFFQKSWRKNVCVFYFLICFLNNTFCINSTMLQSIFIATFNINVENSNVIYCKILYYISYFSSIYYPIVLILASIDRLLISRRLAYFSISINTFVCAVFSLHILIKVNIQQFAPSVFLCYYDLSISYINFFLYSTLIISAIIPLVLIILSVLAFKNVRHIRNGPRQHGRQIRTMNKKDLQLLRCLYVHNIVYIICSILIVVSIGYSVKLNLGTSTPMEQAVSNFLTNIGAFLHCIPYCVSFVIFISVSKAFRLEFKRFIYKICRKDLTAVREEQNHQQEPARDNIELNNVVNTIAVHA
jgi:hypothetical protein